MRERPITILELVTIAATRGMIGFGAGLLVSEHLKHDRRKTVGVTLVSIGLASTIPLALRFFRRQRVADRATVMAD